MASENNNYVLITGATSGIGYEFARLFASKGRNLIIVARKEYELSQVSEELINEFHIDVITMSKDLFDPRSPYEIYDDIIEKGFVVDILINDAGQGQRGKFVDTDLDRDIEIIQLNIISLVALTKLFLKDMVHRNEGKILQVSSIVAQMPNPLMAVYSGTKAFVLKFSEAVINELKDTAVTMTVLQPGATETDFFHNSDGETSKEWQENSLANPADVAKDGYESLMSGESKIVSGFKNKIMTTLSNIIPEQLVASNVRNHMEESDERNKAVHD